MFEHTHAQQAHGMHAKIGRDETDRHRRLRAQLRRCRNEGGDMTRGPKRMRPGKARLGNRRHILLRRKPVARGRHIGFVLRHGAGEGVHRLSRTALIAQDYTKRIVGLRVGTFGEHAPDLVFGTRQLALIAIGVCQIVSRLRIRRLLRHRCFEGRGRGVQLFEIAQHAAAVRMRFGINRLQADRIAVCDERVIGPGKGREQVAQIEMKGRRVRRQSDGGARGCFGFREPPGGLQRGG